MKTLRLWTKRKKGRRDVNYSKSHGFCLWPSLPTAKTLSKIFASCSTIPISSFPLLFSQVIKLRSTARVIAHAHKISSLCFASSSNYETLYHILWFFLIHHITIMNGFVHKMFENHSKCRIWIFEFWYFPPIDLSGNTVRNVRSQCWMRLFLWFSNTVRSCRYSLVYF